mmetsp:Transcript_26609/g.63436  ORF Transcript_26609/g.63436 Transcript_26609/m.63436 type:complete len:458 (-) Transcript_26609:34-1407(-)
MIAASAAASCISRHRQQNQQSRPRRRVSSILQVVCRNGSSCMHLRRHIRLWQRTKKMIVTTMMMLTMVFTRTTTKMRTAMVCRIMTGTMIYRTMMIFIYQCPRGVDTKKKNNSSSMRKSSNNQSYYLYYGHHHQLLCHRQSSSTTTTTEGAVTQNESNNDDDSENQQVPQTNENDHSRPLQIVDMGCGRGYLTFSLHSYLCSTYGKDNVSTLGIDVRPKLVNEMNGITNDLGGSFDTLTFEEGTIEDVVGGVDAGEQKDTNGSGVNKLHENDDSNDLLQVLVALHACDTATDDAIWYGIARGVDVIVVAPCCHKQVRPQLDAHYVSTRKTGHPLGAILRHGIYRERHSETVTDSIRALLLELAGYKVQVFEFIGGEHTSKNVMLSAIKTPLTSPETTESTMEEIRSLASFHGIRKQKLADWMRVSLFEENQSSLLEQQHSSVIRMPRRSKGAQTKKY